MTGENGGRLIRLELENFKSYHGRQIIGPFDENFVSIIGPNGAGKSNLMDALSFVLGIHSGHLRSSNLADLIYRRGETGEDAAYASVTALYQRADGTEVAFLRRISSAGQSEYRIDGRTISYADYCQVWEAENVLIKARNFLVFQGDVESLANKNPRELTRLFEQISGSEEFRAEYDRCKAVYDKALEESSMNFSKKRGLGAELKQVQEQREDGLRYERLMAERAALQTEFYLWKLFHVEEAARKIGAAIEAKEAELAEAETVVKKSEAAWKEAKKKQAKGQKDLLAAERKLKTAQKDMTDGAPQSVQLEEKIKFANQRLATATTSCQNAEQELAQHASEAVTVEREAAEVRKSAERFEESAEERLAAADISSKDLAEYNELRAAVNEQVAKERLKLESLERKLAPEVAARKQLEEKLVELEAARRRVDEETSALNRKHEEITRNGTKVEGEIEAVQRDLAASQAKKLKLEQTEVELTEKLRELMSRLMQAKAEKQENEREVKLRATLEALKRIFPGVHGRMIDLCRPSNRKYEKALSVALGRNLDAIVVEHEKTAIACIQYLKEQRAGQATFIPLDTIQASDSHRENKGLGIEGCRTVMEVVRFESMYERAFAYACGGAVVCDSLAVAKTLCYERDVRVKAITLDGTVIHKSGLITGGVHGQGDRRWEEKEIRQLKTERDQCLALLAETTKSLRRTEADERLRQSLVELESRRRYLADELSAHQQRLGGLQQESTHIVQELEKTHAQLGQAQKSLAKQEKEKHAWMNAIASAEDARFGDFCRRIGFPDIRAFEASRMTLYQEIAERRIQFTSILSKLEHQLAFLHQQREAAATRMHAAQSKVQELQQELAGYESERAQLEAAVEEKRSKVASIKAEIDAIRVICKKEDALVDEKRAMLTEAQSHLTVLSREMTGMECEVDRLLATRKVLLRTCKIEEISLPLSPNNGSGITDFAQVDIDADQSVAPILLNYSSLSKHQRTSSPSDPAVERKFLAKIEAVQEEMDKLAPNLRALDKLEGAESRLRATMEAFERTKNELRRAKDDFSAVKAKRLERFNAAFKHISATIDPIYKELTRSEMVPTGGSAFLNLECSGAAADNEPFAEGIRFHAMPPMKRFLDMDQLSGGERTVAALALLFAIHSFRPAPFFILDEIDAALDAANVQRVAEFIKARATGQLVTSPHALPSLVSSHNTSAASPLASSSPLVPRAVAPVQFLVISLKSSLYSHAGALVGIYRDPEECTSKVLTLRLSDYPE